MKKDIRSIQRKDLDIEAYTRCLLSDEIDGRHQVFPQPAYLDAVAEKWHCYVFGDYEAVMPYFVAKKFGYPYIVMPYLVQQLGVYGPGHLDTSVFFDRLTKRYAFIDYQAQAIPNDALTRTRVNLIKDIGSDEDDHLKTWESGQRYVMRKARRRGYTVRELSKEEIKAVDIEVGVNPHYSSYVEAMHRLMRHANRRFDLQVYAGEHEGNLLGYTMTVTYRQRVHLLYVPELEPQAKTDGLMVLFYYHMILSHLGKDRILDYGGSDMPRVYNFLKRFGTQHENYICLSKRPWWLKQITSLKS